MFVDWLRQVFGTESFAVADLSALLDAPVLATLTSADRHEAGLDADTHAARIRWGAWLARLKENASSSVEAGRRARAQCYRVAPRQIGQGGE